MFLVTASASAAIAWSVAPEPSICEAAPLAEIWDDARREAIERAFLELGGDEGRELWALARARLDARADAWTKMYGETCSDGEDPEQHERLACLESRRGELATISALLADAGQGEIQRAIVAIEALPEVSLCSDLALARAVAPSPQEPAQAAPVAELRSELAELEIRRNAGQFRRAADEILAVSERARDTGFTPLIAEAELMYGRALIQLDRHDDAIAHAEESWRQALRSSHDLVAAKALIFSAFAAGYYRQRYEHARGRFDDAEAFLGRLASIDPRQRDLLRAQLSLQRGYVAFRQAEYDYARAELNQALELMRAHHPEDALALSRPYDRLAAVEMQTRNYDESRALFERSRAIRAQNLGPRHPLIGATYNNLAVLEKNVATYQKQPEAYDRALEYLDAAYEIVRRHSAPGSTAVIMNRRNFGNTLIDAGRYEQAIEVFAALRAETRAATPKAYKHLLDALLRQTEAYLLLGRGAEVEEELERELATLTAEFGGEEKIVARAYMKLALIAQERGDAALSSRSARPS